MVLSGWPGSKRPIQAFWVQTTLETVPYKHFGPKLFFLRLPGLSKRHLPMGLGLACLSKRYLPNVVGTFTYFKRPVQGLRLHLLHLLHLHPLSRPLRGMLLHSLWPFKLTFSMICLPGEPLTRHFRGVATSCTPFKPTFTRVAISFTPFKLTFPGFATSFTPLSRH